MKQIAKKDHTVALIACISLAYLMFPSNNPVPDALGYAGDVKYSHALFQPHHLLYGWFNHLVFSILHRFFPVLQALPMMQAMNSIFTVFSLFVLHKMLKNEFADTQKANIWTLFVGCCFGVMRFAVEGETYAAPVFFSLLASLFFQKYLFTKKSYNILVCSIFASVACLFHQIHLFWGIGLFLGFLRTKNLKNILLYCLPTLSVPAVYSCVMVNYENTDFSIENLVRYLAHYYLNSNADTNIDYRNFLLSPISFFRTFLQVHGLILNILKLYPTVFSSIIFSAFLLCIYLSFKNCKNIKIRYLRFNKNIFAWTHFWIFILQFAFACYSHGNAEFMVMLPYLIPVFIYNFLNFNILSIRYVSFAFLIWNFWFAIFPNNFYNFQNNKKLVEFIRNNPNKMYCLMDKDTVLSLYYYTFGEEIPEKVINESMDTIPYNHIIYTDCLSKTVPFNRMQMVERKNNENIEFVRHIQFIPNVLGGFYIDEIRIKNERELFPLNHSFDKINK